MVRKISNGNKCFRFRILRRRAPPSKRVRCETLEVCGMINFMIASFKFAIIISKIFRLQHQDVFYFHKMRHQILFQSRFSWVLFQPRFHEKFTSAIPRRLWECETRKLNIRRNLGDRNLRKLNIAKHVILLGDISVGIPFNWNRERKFIGGRGTQRVAIKFPVYCTNS